MVNTKKINLKKDVNVRGWFGEFLASEYMNKYGSSVSDFEGILKLKNKKHKKYLMWYGSSIDGFRLGGLKFDEELKKQEGITDLEYENISVVYEVKTKWEDTKSTRFNLLASSYNSYVKAIELDIPTKLVVVTFFDNLDIGIDEKVFDKKYFMIRKKEMYKEYQPFPYGLKQKYILCPTCGRDYKLKD